MDIPDIANDDTFGQMDKLDYQYQGNKLLNVTELSSGAINHGFKDGNTTQSTAEGTRDYVYDDNGNMTVDWNKGITDIEYNHLNLPTKVEIGGGIIDYVYDAAGIKLKKTAMGTENGNPVNSVTEYAGNYVYSGNTEGTALQFFNHVEGYVNAENNGYGYVYQYKDHLGNVRLSYTEDPSNPGSPTIIEESNYYPFGGKHRGYNIGGDTSLGNDVAQRWKFGGKEYDESLGLETYDFGARNYDSWLGRWMNIDPLADKYYEISPYVYVANMPIRAIDPDGKRIVIPIKGNANSSSNVRSRLTIQKNLQKLTNQKIRVVKRGNNFVVKIADGKANSDKNLKAGTKLVSDLIKSDKTISISLGDQNVTAKSPNGNSSITFNANNEGKDIANEDGTTGRPAEIGLAHELIHADENLDGETDNTEVDIVNPDGPDAGKVETTDQDELNVRERENGIRDEQKVVRRKKPEVVKN